MRSSSICRRCHRVRTVGATRHCDRCFQELRAQEQRRTTTSIVEMLEAAPKVLAEPPTIDEMGAKPAHPVATPAIDAALAVVSAAATETATSAPPKNGLMF